MNARILAASIAALGLVACSSSPAPAAATPNAGDYITATPIASLVVVAHFSDGTTAPVELAPPPPVATEPRALVTVPQMVAAFVRAGIAEDEAATLALAWATCEAPFYDLRAGASGSTPTGVSIGISLNREPGDGGRSHGPGQFFEPTWGHLFATHDPYTVEGAAALAKIARDESVRIGRAPLWPWTCARGVAK
ncbi:hypothetical protein UFOVP1383_4 [uncultured Caudovirales phage]|uniref:Uncharacterized protein n=1 Tax=uncultured Caudovirales phage TaxID=2100421 RepID=A0A6J5QDU2_9CAUD|nr:hypothetical protein UFOVP848_37 [uncultured Caudovirales phage]CAB4173230.1 hypothetical protein UFOVP945_28 [uncultured Caudovirales phage]CAB4179611.1 hypothetical protein UFOVP1023_14 [uncultured Caudovirales phage]CAB4203789.1 hypothetical protein UFOVP1383_4 [uncultured Caudovirales phage]CAB4216024.1 hypothetical protein UFOVP1477_44 [uncultured Caudovirales phage]